MQREGNTVTTDTNEAGEARLFDPSEVPQSLRYIPDFGKLLVSDGGRRTVIWGWNEWVTMHSRLARHVKKYGRRHLANTIKDAQQELLPGELQRTELAVNGMCAVNSKPDVLDLIAFITLQKQQDKRAAVARKKKPALHIVRNARTGTLTDAMCAAATPPTPPQKCKRLSDGGGLYLELLQSSKGWFWRYRAPDGGEHRVSLGKFPAVNCDMARQLAEGAREVRLTTAAPKKRGRKPREAVPADLAEFPEVPQLQPKAREALQPPLQAAQSPDLQAILATPIGVFLPAISAFLGTHLQNWMGAQEKRQQRAIEAAVRKAVIDVVGPPVAAPAAAAPLQDAPRPDAGAALDSSPAPAVGPAAGPAAPDEVPHSLEDQLAHAAQALGIPSARRESVLIVGVHPKVEQEVERSFGRAFRFYFKRPDAFNSSNDIPASVDAVLIARKPHMPSDITAFFRRTSMPNKKITNDANSVMWALRELFSDDHMSQVH